MATLKVNTKRSRSVSFSQYGNGSGVISTAPSENLSRTISHHFESRSLQLVINEITKDDSTVSNPVDNEKSVDASETQAASASYGMMKSSFCTQVRLLLWKNIQLDLRRFQTTIVEILLPTLFALVILVIRLTNKTTIHGEKIYDGMPIGMLGMRTNFSLGYYPENAATTDVIKRAIKFDRPGVNLTQVCKTRDLCPYRGFSVQDEALGYFKANFKKMTYLIDLRHNKFSEKADKMPKKTRILMRPYRKENQLWHTDEMFPFEIDPMPKPEKEDMQNYHFAYVQNLLAHAVMANWNKSDVNQPFFFGTTLLRYPTKEYQKDHLYRIIMTQLTLFEVLAYMLIAFVFTKNIVQEKESKLKESMRLIGLSLHAYWLSWLLTFLIFITPTVIAFTLVLTIDFTGHGAIFEHISAGIIVVQLTCYSLALISYSFFISTLVQKSSDAMIISGLIFLLTYIPFEVLHQQYKDLSKFEKLSSCLLFNVALGFSNFNLARRNYNGMGLTWENINQPIDDGDMTVLENLFALIIDAFFYTFLTWYIDNVHPGDYGVPKPWNFFLLRTYWCRRKQNQQSTIVENPMDTDSRSYYLENVKTSNQCGIHLYRLTKRFGDLVSVNNLNLKIYEGEITVLLGHNGAGKTTTMSMLTGFIPPTNGTAIVNGYNIKTSISKVRRSLGLCPQHDILYDVLSPEEHLWFYSCLKGYKSKTLKQEIKDMLEEIGLHDNATQWVSTMSAGQKRSLSVGIALLGDSKVVILDEPSSGMDPSTRRQTWDVLMKHKTKRTMLLTTHYMDEADALGDRIAIMAGGQLQCCGSSMFLKKLYGTGMRLVIEGNEAFDSEALNDVMISHLPNCALESEKPFNVCYLLPESDTVKFPILFRYLSDNKEELGINQFGIRTTTMEEVFLKSEKTAPKAVKKVLNSEKNEKALQPREIGSFIQPVKRYDQGLQLFLRRCKAQLKKRYIVNRVNYITTTAQQILPVLFYLVFVFVDSAMVKEIDKERPLRWFNVDDYGKSKATTVSLYNGHSGLEYLNIAEKILKGSKGYVDVKTYLDRNYTHMPFKKTLAKDLPDSDVRKSILNKRKTLNAYDYDRKYILGNLYEKVNNTPTGVVMYNAEPNHALFISNQLLINTFAQHLFTPDHNIQFGNFPLNKEGESDLYIWFGEEYRSSFFVGLFIGIGFCIYASFTVFTLLKERVSGVKHMHAMFGVGMITYWLPTYLWDLFCFIIPTCLLYGIFRFFDKHEFLDNSSLVFLVLMMYMWAMFPTVYVMHFLFISPSGGLIAVAILNLFGIVFSAIIFNELNNPKSDHRQISKVADVIFAVVIPTYDINRCFGLIYLNYNLFNKCNPKQDSCAKFESLCCKNNPKNCKSALPDTYCFRWTDDYLSLEQGEGIGIYLCIMCIQGFVGWLAVFVIEIGLSRIALCAYCLVKKGNTLDISKKDSILSQPEEDMVKREKQLVMHLKSKSPLPDESCLVIDNMYKNFGTKTAVDHVYAAVKSGECFGILGQSGAGKTTLFRMLTGQTIVSSGNAYLNGKSVRTDLRSAQQLVGYCPQYDAHIPEMTAYETLRFYAMLRGVPEYQIGKLVEGLIERVLLDDSAVNKCGNYSGGNRRKLSLAIALIADPPFLFLDEPSSGMDPKARRQMWNVLSEIRDTGRTIVITSHSMEECEALSTKLAIMLSGKFLCMDSPLHLKRKYGQGYTIIIKEGKIFEESKSSTRSILRYIKKRLPGTKLFDEHPGYLHLQIPNKDVDIGEVFAAMEDCKAEMGIEDYVVNETTLEQIFLAFIKASQNQVKEPEDESSKSCWHIQAGFFDDKVWSCLRAKEDEAKDETIDCVVDSRQPDTPRGYLD